MVGFSDYPALEAYTARLTSRPAYLKAVERGGPVIGAWQSKPVVLS